ncbi:unnamed protein product [Rotaria magnacalcarata]
MRLIASYSERRMDIHGLSEQIRIIMKGTILTGDFNATSDEWGSQSTDRRGQPDGPAFGQPYKVLMISTRVHSGRIFQKFINPKRYPSQNISDLAKAPEIDPLNPHDIQIKTEFREL